MTFQTKEPLTMTDAEETVVLQSESHNVGTFNVDQSSSSKIEKELSISQKGAYIAAHAFSLTALVLVIKWIQYEEMGGGGVSWKQGEAPRVFNWHPILMVVSFAFMTTSTIAFRRPFYLLQNNKKYNQSLHAVRRRRSINKFFHASSWTITLICASVGIYAAFKSHNDPISGYIANLYSFHSWMGIVVIYTYVLQFLIGFNSFVLPNTRKCANIRESPFWLRLAPAVMKFHKFMGSAIYYLTSATIILGIMEKEGFIGCSYKVDNGPDLVPFQHFNEIPMACKVGDSLGFVIVSTTICTGYVLYTTPYPDIMSKEELESNIV